jgi:hypothetical protein
VFVSGTYVRSVILVPWSVLTSLSAVSEAPASERLVGFCLLIVLSNGRKTGYCPRCRLYIHVKTVIVNERKGDEHSLIFTSVKLSRRALCFFEPPSRRAMNSPRFIDLRSSPK